MNQYGDREIVGNSTKWKNWMCQFLPTTCVDCMKKHGSIYPFSALFEALHYHCYCELVPMRCKSAGTATKAKRAGVDLFVKYTGTLPGNYLTREDAIKHGWMPKAGNLANILPGKMIGGNTYKNKDGKLPQAQGRVWYEADFNYISGYRNDSRILYSSDGLIFVTYDHYKTFYEIN